MKETRHTECGAGGVERGEHVRVVRYVHVVHLVRVSVRARARAWARARARAELEQG